MAFDTQLADRLRNYLLNIKGITVEEKKMFGGLAFMVNGKMCVNVSGDNLMLRFDPQLHHELSVRKAFLPMIMNGRKLEGYCYISHKGFQSEKDFAYFVNLCLDYNKNQK